MIYNPSVRDLVNYVRGVKEISAGYSATMGVNYSSDGLWEHLNGNVFWLVIGGIALLSLTVILIIADKSGWIMIVFLSVLPVAYKHGIITLGAASFYEGGMLASVAFMTLDWNYFFERFKSRIHKNIVFISTLSIVLVVCLYFGGLFGRAGHMLNQTVFRFPSNYLNCIYEDGRRAEKLSEEIVKVVKDGTVCLYPYELTAIFHDELDGVFFPTLQEYNGYTPWLDQQNAVFFAKQDAPDYLIIRWYDSAYRFPLIENPKMWESILNNYSFVMADGNYVVLGHRQESTGNNELQLISSESYNGQLEVDQEATYFSIDMEMSFWGKIKGLLWKNDEVDLLVFMEDGKTVAGRVTPQVLSSPFPINYIVSNSDQLIQELSGDHEYRAVSFSLQGKGLEEFKSVTVNFYK